MKRVLAFVASLAVAAIAAMSMAGAASATGEVAEADLNMTAQSGGLYTNALKPVNWRVDVKVTAPFPANPTILPLKKVSLDFTTDMKFVPKNGFPVCGDDKVGPPPVNMSVPPATIIQRCPDAVLGNGSAELHLAKVNYANGPNLKDPVLIVFNGGKTSSGLPKIKIYGFSKGTGAGIFMEGVLQPDGKLDILIPVLTYDSAVGRFDLNIPGTEPVKYNNADVPGSMGLDKTYVQAKCSTGHWDMTAKFTLGERDTAGEPIGTESVIDAPPVSKTCVGTPSTPQKAKLAKPKVKGAAKAKRGKKVTYRVTVKNSGKAAAKGVKIAAKGKGAKGAAKVGTIAAGKSKTVKVKVKFTKKGKSKVTFTAKSSNGGSSKATKTVKVK